MRGGRGRAGGGGRCLFRHSSGLAQEVVRVTTKRQHSPHSPCIILLASFPRLTSPDRQERETVRGKLVILSRSCLRTRGLARRSRVRNDLKSRRYSRININERVSGGDGGACSGTT